MEFEMERIVLTEDFRIPGTDIILEAGDAIQVMPEMNESDINSEDFEWDDLNLSKVVKYKDSYDDSIILPSKAELSKLEKHLNSLGFKKVSSKCMDLVDVEDESHGKPAYSVYIIKDHDSTDPDLDGYADVLIYHPNWGY